MNRAISRKDTAVRAWIPGLARFAVGNCTAGEIVYPEPGISVINNAESNKAFRIQGISIRWKKGFFKLRIRKHIIKRVFSLDY
jgi:hypothetical protein